jgi:hypothetical protein
MNMPLQELLPVLPVPQDDTLFVLPPLLADCQQHAQVL